MSTRITVQVDEIPEVDVSLGYPSVGEWTFPFRVTADDVAAMAAAKTWYDQHPEVDSDGD